MLRRMQTVKARGAVAIYAIIAPAFVVPSDAPPGGCTAACRRAIYIYRCANVAHRAMRIAPGCVHCACIGRDLPG